jgi:alpha-galactosidase
VSVRWKELGMGEKCAVVDLWKNKDLGVVETSFSPRIEPHGAGLYRVIEQGYPATAK